MENILMRETKNAVENFDCTHSERALHIEQDLFSVNHILSKFIIIWWSFSAVIMMTSDHFCLYSDH